MENILTAQKKKFSIKDFLFSKCEQYLLKKSFMENFIFYAVSASWFQNIFNASTGKKIKPDCTGKRNNVEFQW